MWQCRSQKLELIDLGPDHYSIEEYRHCLTTLDRVGRWLGGDTGTFTAIKAIRPAAHSYLDVGCGGGSFTSRLAMKFPQAKIVGIDLNPLAIQYAQDHQDTSSTHLKFETREKGELDEPEKSYDVVLTTLVCHHLSDEAIVDFLKRAMSIAKKRVIINDLHRTPLAYYLFKGISPLFFRNRLVQHDGPLSVLRSFTRQDWMNYLERAGISKARYKIKWQWAFRWIIEINCES
jgi:2-polyprenyl-3-methyl-5-hydroxy-6-metoxy-1,4-benzoquinol methylase